MLDLIRRIRATAQFDGLVKSLRAGHTSGVGGLWGSSCALFAAAVADPSRSCLLLVCPNLEDAEDTAEDIGIFAPGLAISFPPRQWLTSGDIVLDHDVVSRQLDALRQLQALRQGNVDGGARTIVTAAPALIQPVVKPDELAGGWRSIEQGTLLDLHQLSDWLVSRDFERVPMVELPGEFSIRGGIVDIFPQNVESPFRIELDGDRMESIRRFEPSTQRSQEPIPRFTISALSREQLLNADPRRGGMTIADYLPENALVAFREPMEVQGRAEREREQLDDPSIAFDYTDVYVRLAKHPVMFLTALPATETDDRFDYRAQSAQRFEHDTAAILEELDRIAAQSDRVCIFCDNEAEEKRLREILKDTSLEKSSKLEFLRGYLSSGFVLPEMRIACIGNHEIFNRYQQRRVVRRRSTPIESFLELETGDYVVHLAHGIARYRGMERLRKGGEEQEFLRLEFAEKSTLYVPATKIDLVQRYVGTFKARPKLSHLGGKRWEAKKDEVKKAVRDFAIELLRVQALRKQLPGIAYPPDTEWQKELEDAFIYQETDDQLVGNEEIKRDMESPKPMDRLLCGDVGYGKTELAMRAAFKAVMFGKQVAVLVPTTVLAQQHFNTFSERMADYPINIDVISRFRTRAEQREIIDHTAAGKVDILIGTHRLLSDDVRFSDLGLVIIDEEQRFGVEHKEKLKKLRELVDVLTMTATPIPRTLHMSLLGIKDISSLNTPPVDRIAIHTEVCRFDKHRIREAILSELQREGQVFFVHNRVYNIEAVCGELMQLVPEARYAVGHGQMHEHQLEDCMAQFIDHHVDVLVSTTIIESGLDIPNANTIIVNESDSFGLADLHQLRGRVGRYKHRAYAYFLLPRSRPITQRSVRRLKAIEDFSELGAGFKIAMRDLEIRGAGNILGVEQSGHITAVGYDLYCRLLETTVRELKNEPPPERYEVDINLGLEAYLPDGYVPGARQRIQVYRKLAACQDLDGLRDLTAELNDRFGPMPPRAQSLFDTHELRILAGRATVSYIAAQDSYLVVKFLSLEKVEQAFRGVKGTVRIIDDQTLHLHPPDRIEKPGQWVKYLKRCFGAEPAAPRGSPERRSRVAARK